MNCRNVAADLLSKTMSSTSEKNTSEKNLGSDKNNNIDTNGKISEDDAFYANSYSSYSIHLEMLQVSDRSDQAILTNIPK